MGQAEKPTAWPAYGLASTHSRSHTPPHEKKTWHGECRRVEMGARLPKNEKATMATYSVSHCATCHWQRRSRSSAASPNKGKNCLLMQGRRPSSSCSRRMHK